MSSRHAAIPRQGSRRIHFGQRLEAVAANVLVCVLGVACLFIAWGIHSRQSVRAVPIGGAIMMGLALACLMLMLIGDALALHVDGEIKEDDESEANDKPRPY